MKIEGMKDLRCKNISYIAHFGKIMVDDLMKQAGIPETEYKMVRVGMNVTDAIMREEIDTGIGFTNFQKIELEELSGKPVHLPAHASLPLDHHLTTNEMLDLGPKLVKNNGGT